MNNSQIIILNHVKTLTNKQEVKCYFISNTCQTIINCPYSAVLVEVYTYHYNIIGIPKSLREKTSILYGLTLIMSSYT